VAPGGPPLCKAEKLFPTAHILAWSTPSQGPPFATIHIIPSPPRPLKLESDGRQLVVEKGHALIQQALNLRHPLPILEGLGFLTDIPKPQSVYSPLAGHEDLNDAERFSQNPTFRLIGSEKTWDRGVALAPWLHRFETEMPPEEENLAGLAELDRALMGKVEATDTGYRTALDLDSTETPVYGEQGRSAYSG
jgi:hypothetical protein